MKLVRFAVVTTVLGALAVPAGARTSDGRLKVATTFTVIADMARNVAGDRAEVISITKPGAEIHNYQPTPRDLVAASDTDLILSNGLGLELWFQQFIDNLGDIPSATVTEGIDPMPITQGPYEGKANPHAWMGLDSAIIYIDNIRDALAEHDPANADAYAANAAAYADQLRATVGPLRDRIAAIPQDRRWLATCEGAFSYLARDFGLKELYLWPINADQVGTPKQVRAVIDAVREHDIPAVFCESTVDNAPAQQVARETGAAYGGVLYVDSLSPPDGPVPSYLDLLRITSQTIANGLDGGGQ